MMVRPFHLFLHLVVLGLTILSSLFALPIVDQADAIKHPHQIDLPNSPRASPSQVTATPQASSHHGTPQELDLLSALEVQQSKRERRQQLILASKKQKRLRINEGKRRKKADGAKRKGKPPAALDPTDSKYEFKRWRQVVDRNKIKRKRKAEQQMINSGIDPITIDSVGSSYHFKSNGPARDPQNGRFLPGSQFGKVDISNAIFRDPVLPRREGSSISAAHMDQDVSDEEPLPKVTSWPKQIRKPRSEMTAEELIRIRENEAVHKRKSRAVNKRQETEAMEEARGN
jgi:hypothetical protein